MIVNHLKRRSLEHEQVKEGTMTSGVTKQDATITRDAPELDDFLRGVLKSAPESCRDSRRHGIKCYGI